LQSQLWPVDCVDNACVGNILLIGLGGLRGLATVVEAPVDDIGEDFRQALRGVASTVTVITACDGERHHGMTVTAVMSVSMDPPALAICINQSTLLHEILEAAEGFCVNVLHDRQEPVSAAFSGAVPPGERFKDGQWSYDAEGLAYLGCAQSNIFCRKVATVPYGTHCLFIGEVSKVRFGRSQQPLLYLNAGYCTSLPHSAVA
jgi:flavin reductase (DIM6/NTAB) family NADH-FMN oxidoreductase RutF